MNENLRPKPFVMNYSDEDKEDNGTVANAPPTASYKPLTSKSYDAFKPPLTTNSIGLAAATRIKTEGDLITKPS